MHIADVKKFLFHLHMTIFASLNHFMLFDPVIDLLHRVTGEAVAAAVSHGVGVGAVAVNAGEHGFMPEVVLDIFFQCRMAGQTITGAPKQRNGQKGYYKEDFFHDAIILYKK
jgi:hypothetical protein